MSETNNFEFIDHAAIMPNYAGGRQIEIIGRRTLHGPMVKITVPYSMFCKDILRPVCQQQANELKAARERMGMLNGSFVFEDNERATVARSSDPAIPALPGN